VGGHVDRQRTMLAFPVDLGGMLEQQFDEFRG